MGNSQPSGPDKDTQTANVDARKGVAPSAALGHLLKKFNCQPVTRVIQNQ